MTRTTEYKFAQAAGYGDAGVPRSRLVLGFAVLASLAIHGSGLLLLPGKSDHGVADFGQGGITVSLGPAGRDAGGEVARAEAASEASEDLETAETEAVEPETATLSDTGETLEAEPEISPLLDAPEAVEEIVPEPETPYEILRDTEVSEAELTEAEPEAETTEVEVEAVPILQEDSIALAAKAVTPPLPRRRPQVTKAQSLQTPQQAEAPVQPRETPKPEAAVQKALKESTEPRAERSENDGSQAAEGESETQTDNQVLGEGGRSGQSGLSEAGQGDNTAGGGSPGAASDYYGEVQAWLEKHKRYPRRSKLRSEEGVVMLRFVVNREGIVTLSDIKKSSGHKRLDKEAMGMIERAQPLPAMPKDMRQANLEIVVPVRFYLQ